MAFSPLSGSMIDPLTRTKRQIYATTPIEHEQLKKAKDEKYLLHNLLQDEKQCWIRGLSSVEKALLFYC